MCPYCIIDPRKIHTFVVGDFLLVHKSNTAFLSLYILHTTYCNAHYHCPHGTLPITHSDIVTSGYNTKGDSYRQLPRRYGSNFVTALGPLRAQKFDSWILGMSQFPEKSGRCLITSEVTRTQDPHQQMQNEISV